MRALRTLALLIFLAAPASAADPAPVNVSGWSVAQYNDYLTDLIYQLMVDMRTSENQLLSMANPDQAEVFRRALRKHMVDTRAAASALPPWKGDATVRDAILGGLNWFLDEIDHGVVELYGLAEQAEVHSADLDRAEQLNRQLREGADRMDRDIRAAQAAFAKKHHYILVEDDRTLPAEQHPDTFSAPGVPPEGSTLSATVHVSFAVRYQNGLVNDEAAIVGVANGFMEAASTPGDGAQRYIAEHAGELDALASRVSARGDWRGDASLLEATQRLEQDVSTLLSGPGAELAGLLNQSPLKKKEFARYEEVLEQVNTSLSEALARWNSAQATFSKRWAIDAYMAWQSAHVTGG